MDVSIRENKTVEDEFDTIDASLSNSLQENDEGDNSETLDDVFRGLDSVSSLREGDDSNRITPSPRVKVPKNSNNLYEDFEDSSLAVEDGEEVTVKEEEEEVATEEEEEREGISLIDLMAGRYYRQDEVGNTSMEETVDTPALPDEEYEQVMALNKNGILVADQTYFLVSAVWWRKWKEFSMCNGVAFDRPDCIDNSSLLIEFIPDDSLTMTCWKLKRNILERSDYMILCEDAWKLLHGWYGGGPVIQRKCYQDTDIYAKLDLYGIDMKVIRSDTEDEMKVNCRKMATIGDFLKALANQWGVKYNPKKPSMRLWDYYNKSRYALLENTDMLMHEANISEDQDMMVEFKQDDGTWKWAEIEKPTNSYSSTSNYYSSYNSSSYYSRNTSSYSDQNVIVSSHAPPAKGLVGLSNLGNTCFMNSIIQSLSASTPLREVFISKAYKSDLNLNNPLGHDGKVAEGFADLFDVLYKPPEEGGGDVVAPRHFKRMIGDIAPQFQGYDQHDSQELLNFLLDGLHEDLNRVLVKESTAPVDSGDRPDEEVAKEALEVYKKRNDSIIADMCSGQFKSTVVCPDCGLKSRTFDAYFSISIPLVKESALEMNLAVKLITQTGFKSIYNLSVPRVGPVGCIKALIAEAYTDSQTSSTTGNKLKELLPINLVVVELHLSSFYKVFDDLDSIEDISKSDEIVCYEVTDRQAFFPSTQWEPLPDKREWFASCAQAASSWVADFDTLSDHNVPQTDQSMTDENAIDGGGSVGSSAAATSKAHGPKAHASSPWKHGDVWIGAFKPGKVRKRKSSMSSYGNLLDDYDCFDEGDSDNFNFVTDATVAMPCRIQVIAEDSEKDEKDEAMDDGDSSVSYKSLLKSLELSSAKNGVSFEKLQEDINQVSSLCVFSYEGKNKKQCSIILGLKYDSLSDEAFMFPIGSGHWISKSSNTLDNGSDSCDTDSSAPPKLNFKFRVGKRAASFSNDPIMMWSQNPDQGSTDGTAVIQKLNIISEAAPSDRSSSNDSGYVMVLAPQQETQNMQSLAGDDEAKSQSQTSGGVVLDKEDQTDDELNSDDEVDSDEGDDDSTTHVNDRDTIVVKVVHKVPPLSEYGISRKVGIPMLLTLPSSYTEKQVREAIVKEVEAKYGADLEIPFNLKRANKSFDDNGRYERAGSDVGKLVGVGKRKHARFWKPKKAVAASSTYYTGSNYYSQNNYHSSSASSNSFNDAHHVNLVMNWQTRLTEKDIFCKKNKAVGSEDVNGNDDDTACKEGKNVMTLEDCLNLFAVTEKLSQSDSWFCPICKDFKEATKKMDLWTTPPILSIHLKRFSIDSTSFWADKLETPVAFPIDEMLDMSKHCLSPNKAYPNYMLYAVSNHFGGTGGGHYTANVRSFENGKWYDCDDSSVSEVRSNSFDGKVELDRSAAYVLFYIREDYIPETWKKQSSNA